MKKQYLVKNHGTTNSLFTWVDYDSEIGGFVILPDGEDIEFFWQELRWSIPEEVFFTIRRYTLGELRGIPQDSHAGRRGGGQPQEPE